MQRDPKETVVIRPASGADVESLARIYNHYVRETIITFEEVPVTAEDMAARIEGIRAIPLPWLVAERDGEIVGYTFAKKWKERSAYRFATETSIFLDPSRVGRGTGSLLYRRLLDELRSAGIHCALSGIALPNQASIALHESLGFTKVAHIREVGFKFQKWIDVGYWQRTL